MKRVFLLAGAVQVLVALSLIGGLALARPVPVAGVGFTPTYTPTNTPTPTATPTPTSTPVPTSTLVPTATPEPLLPETGERASDVSVLLLPSLLMILSVILLGGGWLMWRRLRG